MVSPPLPQALILTSIVIGFGVLAFALALADRVNQEIFVDDLDALHTSDEVVVDSAPMPAEPYEDQEALLESESDVPKGARR